LPLLNNQVGKFWGTNVFSSNGSIALERKSLSKKNKLPVFTELMGEKKPKLSS